MERVVVERQFDQPITWPAYDRFRQSAQWCLDRYRVAHRATYLSSDGRATVCLFDAPDAEALRMASRTMNFQEGRAWATTLHLGDGIAPSVGNVACRGVIGFETVVVERAFATAADLAEIAAIEQRGAWCLEAHRVRWLCTYFARDRRRMLCVYEAPDAESTRLAQSKATMPFERVWTAELHPEA